MRRTDVAGVTARPIQHQHRQQREAVVELASAVIFGVVTGSLYGLAALGIVLVYRVSRVLNFALAGTASITSYEASTMTDAGWPYWAVLVATLLSGAVLGAMCYAVLSLSRSAAALTVGVGTIGLLLLMQGGVGSIWGLGQRTLPEPISGTFHIGGIGVSHFEVMAVVIALVAIFLAFLLVYRTTLGLRMRAVSAGPKTAELLGVNRRTTEVWAWSIGGAAGSLAGLLIVPLLQLDQNVIVNFMLAAFAAVVLGGFTSLGGVILAGVAVSIVLNILSTYVSSTHIDTFTLLLVAFVLLLRPNGLFGFHESSVAEPRVPARSSRWLTMLRTRARRSAPAAGAVASRTPSRSFALPVVRAWRWDLSVGQIVVPVALAGALVYGYASGGSTSYIFATALATFISVLGVGCLVGLTGQVSLGQGAFVGLGAYTAGIVSVHLQTSVWLSLPLALVVGAVVGLVIGLPVARLSGVYLIVFTLAFGLAVPELLLGWTGFTGGANGLTVNVPTFLIDARHEYLVALAVAALAAGLYAVVSRTQPGRRWRAVQDSEAAVSGIGWSPTIAKITAFTFGSALAALGGALGAIQTGYVSADGFTVFLSINLVVAVIVGGPGTIVGALTGALFITLLPYYLSGSNTPQLIFGIAVVVILILAPDGVANTLARRRHRADPLAVAPLDDRVPEPAAPRLTMAVPALADSVAERPDGRPPVLDVRGLTVRYSGGDALERMSLTVGAGEAVTVVGANGAGKSTLLRAISGWVRPYSGSVRLGGAEITGDAAYRIARRGVVHVPEGRCVFPDLSVADNLRLGYRASSGTPQDELLDEALAIFPKLRRRMNQRAGSMSGGEQQMLAVGRGLMAAPELLMLDEPSLGLAPVIIGEMFEALGLIVERGASVLLIEQNVHAALRFADRGYVLSRGECVMTGAAEELNAQDDLVRAFLVQA